MNAVPGRRRPGPGYRRRRADSDPVRYAAAPGSAAAGGAGPTPTAAALAMTLGVAAACWVVAVREMTGMEMGTATRPGSFGFFIAVWAAMMLPGAAPAVLRRVQVGGGARAVPLFAGSYLAVWALAGVAVYALYRPHGPFAAGTVVTAAGVYEFTPVKRHFRRRCRDSVRSGFGLCCLGSSIGLMAMLVALGVTWMAVIAVLVLAQKLLSVEAAVDIPLVLMIVGLGIWTVLAPSSVPGLAPPM